MIDKMRRMNISVIYSILISFAGVENITKTKQIFIKGVQKPFDYSSDVGFKVLFVFIFNAKFFFCIQIKVPVTHKRGLSIILF
jgi:hypothetical protein